MANISIGLNTKDLKALGKRISNYQRSVTDDQLQYLREAIGERIKNLAYQTATGSILEGTFIQFNRGRGVSTSPQYANNVDITVQDGGNNVTFVISHGEDMVWLEFGAGVHYNGAVGGKPNPLAANVPGLVGIGQYGKGKGKQDQWIYRENGVAYRTYGTPASMPLYHAIQDVMGDIETIARGVLFANAQP